eukprot:CAMPEP_0201735248 /NCGR_PEP_ID=MMETSP0593-20130828/36557_1 /ASSEMBLY_ACC=CAM_ASM_000672 /TAXON_ID=267983 /ORGANISM="Skeletonema japonicum, Strain CCMP2506" /LENGTH=364 /DNA_ID=CAMNT_0048228765 /DNA_START=27 /DNA_END=1121 /DNA_ORIENTATION=+
MNSNSELLEMLNKMGGMMDSFSGNYSSDDEEPPKPVLPTKVQPGIICQVDGLKSAAGQKLNGCQCAVIRNISEEERFEVRMKDEEGTKALKEANLSPVEKLVLPTHSRRGSSSSARSLCELLLYYKGSGPGMAPEFSPSRIMLTGFAGQCLDHIGTRNLMWLVQVQMEQLAATVGLAKICLDYDEEGAAEVLFALLEGDPMYIDVLIQTIHWTGLIDHDGDDNNDVHSDGFSNCPPTKLTPDQDSYSYVKLMSTGPLRLLVEMTKYKFGGALFEAMKESEFHHLFLQRLLRLVGREGINTNDGSKLGPMARKILLKVLPGINLEKKLDSMKAQHLLVQTSRNLPCQFLRAENVSATTLNEIYFE